MMSWLCSMYGGKEKCIHGFGAASCMKETTMENKGVVGRITLKWFLRKYSGMTWTGLIWLRIGEVSGLL